MPSSQIPSGDIGTRGHLALPGGYYPGPTAEAGYIPLPCPEAHFPARVMRPCCPSEPRWNPVCIYLIRRPTTYADRRRDVERDPGRPAGRHRDLLLLLAH